MTDSTVGKAEWIEDVMHGVIDPRGNFLRTVTSDGYRVWLVSEDNFSTEELAVLTQIFERLNGKLDTVARSLRD